MQEQTQVKTANAYDLKSEHVALIASPGTASRVMDIQELERMHARRSVPASKFGLEAICGASCDTGAQ